MSAAAGLMSVATIVFNYDSDWKQLDSEADHRLQDSGKLGKIIHDNHDDHYTELKEKSVTQLSDKNYDNRDFGKTGLDLLDDADVDGFLNFSTLPPPPPIQVSDKFGSYSRQNDKKIVNLYMFLLSGSAVIGALCFALSIAAFCETAKHNARNHCYSIVTIGSPQQDQQRQQQSTTEASEQEGKLSTFPQDRVGSSSQMSVATTRTTLNGVTPPLYSPVVPNKDTVTADLEVTILNTQINTVKKTDSIMQL